MNKKKLVFIINNFAIGGTERLFLDLICELKDLYELEVVTVLGGGALEGKFQKLASIHNFNPIAYDKRSLVKKIFLALITPVTFLRIVVLLLKVKPDVVVTSLWYADILGNFGAALAGIPTRVLVQHDIQKIGWFKKLVKAVFAIRFSNKIIANSETTKLFLMSYWGVLENKIKVIYNGINVQSFEKGVKVLDEENVVIGVIGRLEPTKGHMCFFQALKILKEKYGLEPKVLIVGDGTNRRSLEKFKICNGLNNVEFLGSEVNIPKVLKLIDVLVAPSFHEGFGLMVLEGLAARKIIVASNIAAFRELIESGNNGILFEIGNSKSLADVLSEILFNPKRLSEHLNKIDIWKNKFISKYDIHATTVKEYIKIFQ